MIQCLEDLFVVGKFHPFNSSKRGEIQLLTLRYTAPELSLFLAMRISESTVLYTVNSTFILNLQCLPESDSILINNCSLD